MLGAASAAGKQPFAVAARIRQGRPFGQGEPGLCRGSRSLPQGNVPDIAQAPLRIHEMVAWIDVPVVLDGQVAAAAIAESADARLYSAPRGQGRIESQDEVPAYIPSHPIVEDIAEIPAECLRIHRPRGQDRLRLFRGGHAHSSGVHCTG